MVILSVDSFNKVGEVGGSGICLESNRYYSSVDWMKRDRGEMG